MSAIDEFLQEDPPGVKLIGGAYEGSSRLSRELALWSPPVQSADREMLPEKQTLDARVRDMARNDGYIRGGVAIHRDNIVGAQFCLSAKPNWQLLGLTEEWAEQFQEQVEGLFTLWAESPRKHVDASRSNTFTALVRLAVGISVLSGETLASVEWIRRSDRPFSTAIQMIDPDRLSNPDGVNDSRFLRRGIELDFYGAPIAYYIRNAHPGDYATDLRAFKWTRVPAAKPWGRPQIIHIVPDQMRPGQTRGVAEMVSVLKEMKMTSRYRDVVLQNAVLNATYAATIESELPPEVAYAQLGTGGSSAWATDYLEAIAQYVGGSNNIAIDGVKVPHLYPGTKLHLQNANSPGGVGTSFEQSLLRHISAALGVSYEQLSRDYTQTNYSSARAAMAETWKYMQSRKHMVADAFASQVYRLWLEEALNKGLIKLPPNAPSWYEGLNAEAYSACEWVGASRGQIDELKETQAAVMRIEKGLSTYEDELARLGKDWRQVARQRKRERVMMEKLGLVTEQVTVSGNQEQDGQSPTDRDEDEGDATDGQNQ